MGGHRPAKELDRSVLQLCGKRSETLAVGRVRRDPAVRRIGCLLEPPPERHARAFQPFMQLGNRVSAVLRVKQGIGQRIAVPEVLRPPRHPTDRMIGRKRPDRHPEVPQLVFRRPDTQNAAVFLEHVDPGTSIGCIDHEMHRPGW